MQVDGGVMAGGVTYNTTATGTSAATIVSASVVLVGFTMRETAGASSRVELRDGTADTSPLVVDRTFVGGESVTDWFGPMGIRFRNGLRLVRPTGSTEVMLYLS
jgi:hypothetical protein